MAGIIVDNPSFWFVVWFQNKDLLSPSQSARTYLEKMLDEFPNCKLVLFVRKSVLSDIKTQGTTKIQVLSLNSDSFLFTCRYSRGTYQAWFNSIKRNFTQ